MKKLALCFAIVGLSAAAALAADDVTSVNVVGFSKVTLPPGSQTGIVMIAMQFDAFDPTLMGVFGTNQLRPATKVGNADQVWLWNVQRQEYDKYALKTDLQYRAATNWSGPATNPPLVSGQGMFIKAGASTTQTNTLTLMGQVVAYGSIETDIKAGWQLISYPFTCDVGLGAMSFTNVGAGTAASKVGNADNIRIWNGTSWDSYGLKSSDRQWHNTTNWSGPAVNPNVLLSQGFWYIAKSDFTWTETNKYLNNL